MALEASIQALGCDLERIKAQHQPLDMAPARDGGDKAWLAKGWARASVVGDLLRLIEADLVEAHAPKTEAGEEDAEALAGVAEMMGMAPSGQGLALVLGVSPGGKGAADSWALLEELVALTWEATETVGGSFAVQAHRSQAELMEQITKVASLPASAGGDAVVFSSAVSGILAPLPPSISVSKEGGVPKAKQWAKGLEEELAKAVAERGAAEGRLAALREAELQYDGPDADVQGGRRQVASEELVEALGELKALSAKFSSVYEKDMSSSLRRVHKPTPHTHLENAAANVHDQMGRSARLLEALRDIRTAGDQLENLSKINVHEDSGGKPAGGIDVQRLESRLQLLDQCMSTS
mmetsp:Transcript_28390/g.70295  ORF Transcript_28390/g.70295 Transcript_28390/m.70295 type:complete len:352 (-) Transcript_28390:229-1284(-)